MSVSGMSVKTLASLASSLFGVDWGVELGAHPAVEMREVDGLED